MSNPQSSLSALTIVTPAGVTSGVTLSVDASILPFIILGDANTTEIDLLVGSALTTLTEFTSVSGGHQFTGSVPVAFASTPQPVQITGRSGDDVSPTIQFDLLYSATSGLALTVAPPSGITVYNGQSSCRVEWAIPNTAGFQGVRVQWSPDSSGVNTPYQQYGGIQTEPTRSANVALTSPVTTTSTTPNPLSGTQVIATETEVSTTTGIVLPVNYGSIDIPQGVVGTSLFYVILTALYQDPTTNQVYESPASGPFTCGFVDMTKVKPTDFPALQQASDIAGRLIAEVTRRRPDLDLTARAEVRDIIINPLSLELANMSVRVAFGRWCQSVCALSQIDDANGDGVSDPVATSQYKQQLARAFGMDSVTLQTFIDSRFDILGEAAGVPRGGATYAVTQATFYTYTRPTALLTVPLNAIVSTVPDATNQTAVSFITRGSAVIDPTSAASYYDPENGWWGVSVPVEAQTAGSAGNVGAGSITQVMGGVQSGLSVTNLAAANNGTDQQSNADYAVMIENRYVVGKDSGTRLGYWNAAMQVSGVIDALVVAAGDLDMVRDWSTQLNKHTFGCVDVYVEGLLTSQQTESVPFEFPTPATYGSYPTYLACKAPVISSGLGTPVIYSVIQGFSSLGSPIYTAVEMTVSNAGTTIWLGVQNAQFDNAKGLIFLNPTDQPYSYNADGTTSPWQINGVNVNNLQLLLGITGSNVTYALMVQLMSGIEHIPALQPVTTIDSVSGPTTGVIPTDDVELVYTTDFLLTGGSAKANDTVAVSGLLSTPVSKTLTLATATTVIDSDISLSIDATGNPQNIISVQNPTTTVPYSYGTDYTIVAAGPYRTYALKIPTGSSITPGTSTQVIANYYQFLLRERLTFQTDQITLVGSTASPLLNGGFISNVWQPVNHGLTALYFDGAPVSGQPATGLMGAGVVPQSRFIKVTFNGAVMLQGKDYLLTVDPDSGAATLTRVLSGGIPDGSTLSVNYYTLEVLSVATEYPACVPQLTTALAASKHAGADTLVKAMVPSPVDLVFNVTLNGATTPSAVDGMLRSACDLTISAAQQTLAQSGIVTRVQLVPGVTGMNLPLTRCAKADGAYNIGAIVPTGTGWAALATDTMFTAAAAGLTNVYISEEPLLADPTVPSGGTPNAYVGMLYEGQAYRRAMSVQDFLTGATPSFYLIGTNDEINTSTPLPSNYSQKILLAPGNASDPSQLSYRVTYQVFGAATASDITVSSSEYLTVGSITIVYNQGA